MSGRAQPYSLRLDVFRHLILSGFVGKEIQLEEKVKYLEDTLVGRLTWSSHIDQVKRKASK
jgi:hypothetical protein